MPFETDQTPIANMRKQFEERVHEIKHGSFSPLLFSTSCTSVTYKHLTFLLSKWPTPNCKMMHWLCCYLDFSLALSHHVHKRFVLSPLIGHPFFKPASVDLVLGIGHLGAL